MQLPKLTPPQSRLLALATARGLVAVLWICSQPNYFAHAAEIPAPSEAVQYIDFEASIPRAPPDDPPLEIKHEVEGEEYGDALYAPDFAYFDESLVGRQEDDLKELNNNEMIGMDIMPNTTRYFRFKKSQLSERMVLQESSTAQTIEETMNGSAEDPSTEGAEAHELETRQAQSRLWISANTCRQPTPTIMLVTDPPPPLKLSVWTQTGNNRPRPNDVRNITFESGYVNHTLSTDQDVFVAVEAPSLTQGWNGSWHFEIAASVGEGYYHGYDNNTQFIYLVDSDSDSTLFITHNLSRSSSSEEVAKWQEMHASGQMPFDIYAFPDDKWSPLMGLERSYCGLKEQFKNNNMSVTTSITTNFGLETPKGQFHVQGLRTSTNYTGFLALNGNVNMTIDGSKVGKGGRVFQSFQWQTKADDTCQVIFGLEECSSVAYAVPSSPEWKNNDKGLIEFYDKLARDYMANFNRSLAQVACDTASTAQYSLARNCHNCTESYKAWLCSVLIPRCEDWTATDEWLHPRNINTPFQNGSLPDSSGIDMKFNDTIRGRFAYNQSRNAEIDKVIKPGPYKEMLPCEDLCFEIVRSCPAQMGFSCPSPPMRELSYGKRDPDPNKLTCSFPGAVVDLQDRNSARSMGTQIGVVVLVAVLTLAWDWI